MLYSGRVLVLHDRFTAEFGVNIVGGCCGTTPEHLRRVVETVGGREPLRRSPVHEPGCASIYTSVPFAQDVSFLGIGERTNANGSKKFKDAMLAGDADTCLAVAREQIKEGAHVLDVCVDSGLGRAGGLRVVHLPPAPAARRSRPPPADRSSEIADQDHPHFVLQTV